MRWRTRIVRVALVVVAVLGFLIGALYFVSWLRLSPVEQAAFFDEEPGENPVLVFAHQGGELLRPSNTMAAFDHAADLGADVLDTDTHLTADGELVLIHDESVDRTSDGTGAVRDLTLAELRGLDFGHRFTTDDGETFPYRGRGESIVTVEELFSRFDDLRFGIEIKQTEAMAAVELCELIRRFGYEDRVLVSSFAQPNMDVFRRECPSVATSATEDEVRRLYILHRLRLIGLTSPDYQALQVPEYSGDRLILSDGFVADASALGLPIVPWTITEPDAMERMIDLGASGVNTDRPDLLTDLLAES